MIESSLGPKKSELEQFQSLLSEFEIPATTEFDASLFNSLLYLHNGVALEGSLRRWYLAWTKQDDVVVQPKLRKCFHLADYNAAYQVLLNQPTIDHLIKTVDPLVYAGRYDESLALMNAHADLLQNANDQEKSEFYGGLARCYKAKHTSTLMGRLAFKKGSIADRIDSENLGIQFL